MQVRLTLAAVMAVIVPACSAAPPPSGSFLPSPSAMATAGATVAPSATSLPSLRPTLPPAPTSIELPPAAALPGEPFDLAWRSVEARGVPFGEGYLTGDSSTPMLVRWGDGAIAVYGTPDGETGDHVVTIWRSSDLVEWHQVDQVDLPPSSRSATRVRQLLVGGPGLVLLVSRNNGGPNTLLVSEDGEEWKPVPSVPNVKFVWARPGVIIGYGAQTWVSRDGVEWSPVGPSPIPGEDIEFLRVTTLDAGEAGIAFLSHGSEPTVVYGLWPDGRWRHLSDLRGVVELGVVGPDAIVALGTRLDDDAIAGDWTAAWRSPDGVNWTTGPGPENAQTIALTRAGYVATSQRIYMSGCDGLPLDEQIAQTWTSHDGLAWRQMPEQRLLDHTVLSFVFPDDGSVHAVGIRWSGSFAGDGQPSFEPVTFEAALPQPEPSHTPLPDPVGCGE